MIRAVLTIGALAAWIAIGTYAAFQRQWIIAAISLGIVMMMADRIWPIDR